MLAVYIIILLFSNYYIRLFFSYAGDAHIKAKLKGIVCGIKDVQFVGEIRVILSPLINTIPLIGAVTFFFLRRPVRIQNQKFASDDCIAFELHCVYSGI